MLRNRKEVEEGKLLGVNRVADPTKLRPGTFVELANWIPGKRYKIKKKRGVEALVNEVDLITPANCVVAVCTDASERGQQALSIETAFNQGALGLSNPRTSWGFISDGECYTLVGEASCAGGNMTYNNICCEIAHFTGGNPTPFETLSLPFTDSNAFINALPGAADQTCWASLSSGFGGLRIIYDIGNTVVDYHTPTTNGGGHAVESWAVKGDEVWAYVGPGLDTPGPSGESQSLCVFDRDAGTLLQTYYPFAGDVHIEGNLHLTTSFCYALGSNLTAGTNVVYKIDRSNGTVTDEIDVTDINGQFMCVTTDDELIYIMGSGSPVAVYYIKNFTDLVYVGKDTAGTVTPFNRGQALFNDGNIYWGSNGFAGFGINIFKIAIACPEGAPVVAGVTVVESTVAHGGSVTVNFGTILEPDSTDRLQLAPVVTGELGFSGATATHQSTSSAASGLVSFSIPGGTTPGDYTIQLVTENGDIFIAQSDPFTVT